MVEVVQKQQCNRCKVHLPVDRFKTKRDGDRQKLCILCNTKSREYKKCEHGNSHITCKLCDKNRLCKHDKLDYNCVLCQGVGVCEHQTRRTICKICEGGSRCKHDKLRTACVQCSGCKHNKLKHLCRDCSGSAFCEHDDYKWRCKECNPSGHLRATISSRVYSALQQDKDKKSIEYLGCDIDTFKQHIESQFEEGMTWDNHGEWHIDHIIPIKYENPTIEDVHKRLHYQNTQPLWASENLHKNNHYVG